ncbi:MFS transporter [Wukongibacter baidiensis]|uniref:MFS transporter n=1 Tax=Wukongibacter baidiensis TaxID=1723361 RepID=UPI003D7FBD5B
MTIFKKYQNKSICNMELSNLILFSLGKFISLFGTFIYTFAIGLYILRLTGSGLSFATTLVFSTLPLIIINPFAGVLADRLNRKFLVVIMDLLNGALMIGLYFLSSVSGLSLTLIYVSTFIMTSFMTIFNTSIEAAIPNIVSEDRLIKINSISKIIDSISIILGPMIGGLIFAFVDIKLFIAINGISFLISGISEMFIDFSFNKEESKQEKEKIDFYLDMKQGLKYMMNKKEITSLFIVFVFLNFSIGLSITVPLPFIINNILKLGSKSFGIIQGSVPIGLIIGAVFVGKVTEKLSYKKILVRMNLVLAICMLLIGVPIIPIQIIKNTSLLLIYYCTIMCIVGVAISFIDIPILGILQKNISDEYRGRVLSLGMSLVKIISPIAFIISGALMNIIPIYLLQVLGSMVLFIYNTMDLIKSRDEKVDLKRSLVSVIKGSVIIFLIELLFFGIFKPRNLEGFLLIWGIIPILLLIDNIFSIRSVNFSKVAVDIEEVVNLTVRMNRCEREKTIVEGRLGAFGGILDKLNIIYVLSFIINLIGYVFVMPK